jgi:hypothetical protein
VTFIVRRTAGRNHYYVDLDIAPRHRVPGVTTICKAMANKRLENYGNGATADYAVNNWETLSAMPPADRVKAIMGGRWEKRDDAAARGTDVHRYGEELLVDKSVDIPRDQKKYVDSYVGFMDISEIHADHIETPCYSATHNFAGTIDIIGSLTLPDTAEWEDVPRDDAGRSFGVLDPKSGKGVYETAALQLCAYANSEFLILEGATSSDPEKRVETPMPSVDFAAAVHIQADGSPAVLVRTDCTASAFRKFLYLAQVYDLQQYAEELLYPPTPYPFSSSYRLVREEES